MHAVASASANARAFIPTVHVAPHQSLLAAVEDFRRQSGHTGHCIIKFSQPQPLKACA